MPCNAYFSDNAQTFPSASTVAAKSPPPWIALNSWPGWASGSRSWLTPSGLGCRDFFGKKFW